MFRENFGKNYNTVYIAFYQFVKFSTLEYETFSTEVFPEILELFSDNESYKQILSDAWNYIREPIHILWAQVQTNKNFLNNLPKHKKLDKAVRILVNTNDEYIEIDRYSQCTLLFHIILWSIMNHIEYRHNYDYLKQNVEESYNSNEFPMNYVRILNNYTATVPLITLVGDNNTQYVSCVKQVFIVVNDTNRNCLIEYDSNLPKERRTDWYYPLYTVSENAKSSAEYNIGEIKLPDKEKNENEETSSVLDSINIQNADPDVDDASSSIMFYQYVKSFGKEYAYFDSVIKACLGEEFYNYYVELPITKFYADYWSQVLKKTSFNEIQFPSRSNPRHFKKGKKIANYELFKGSKINSEYDAFTTFAEFVFYMETGLRRKDLAKYFEGNGGGTQWKKNASDPDITGDINRKLETYISTINQYTKSVPLYYKLFFINEDELCLPNQLYYFGLLNTINGATYSFKFGSDDWTTINPLYVINFENKFNVIEPACNKRSSTCEVGEPTDPEKRTDRQMPFNYTSLFGNKDLTEFLKNLPLKSSFKRPKADEIASVHRFTESISDMDTPEKVQIQTQLKISTENEDKLKALGVSKETVLENAVEQTEGESSPLQELEDRGVDALPLQKPLEEIDSHELAINKKKVVAKINEIFDYIVHMYRSVAGKWAYIHNKEADTDQDAWFTELYELIKKFIEYYWEEQFVFKKGMAPEDPIKLDTLRLREYLYDLFDNILIADVTVRSMVYSEESKNAALNDVTNELSNLTDAIIMINPNLTPGIDSNRGQEVMRGVDEYLKEISEFRYRDQIIEYDDDTKATIFDIADYFHEEMPKYWKFMEDAYLFT